MLTEEQIKEIKEHLDRAQNPVFFFDNDPDGLCSFLLLRRYLGRGKGVVIKSFPDLNEGYFRKVEEFNADYIFILDKPVVSAGFFNKTREVNIPVVWIDHHEVQEGVPDFVHYFNPNYNGGSVTGTNNNNNNNNGEPVTSFCWNATKRKEDMWISIIGCVSDSYLPEFYYGFQEQFQDLTVNAKCAFDVLYKSKLGEVARMFSYGLKDKTSNVVTMLKFLIEAKSPYDVLEENSKNKSFHKRYHQLHAKYLRLLEKAKSFYSDGNKLLFFKYSGDLSISGELANELVYIYPNKTILVAYVNGERVSLSLRGKGIREKFLEAIGGLEGSSGGGHKDAVGGVLQHKNLEAFVERLRDLS